MVTAAVSGQHGSRHLSDTHHFCPIHPHDLTQSDSIRFRLQDCLQDELSQLTGLTTQALQVCFHGNQV